MRLSSVDSSHQPAVLEFLRRHEDTSQILIGNLREHGFSAGAHHNSGDFKVIFDGDDVVGVFCLTKRGNLIAQASRDVAALILDTCAGKEIRGFIGDWATFEPIISLYRARNPSFEPSYSEREVLYSYELMRDDSRLQHHPSVRLLIESDFDQWLPMAHAYMRETGLPDDLSDEVKRKHYVAQVSEKRWWGFFRDSTLVSRASLNSSSEDVGQVGGVFTPPSIRKQGLSKATMFHMLRDCRDLHGHRKSVLFTGEKDLAARALYESMGYKQTGYFALVLA